MHACVSHTTIHTILIIIPRASSDDGKFVNWSLVSKLSYTIIVSRQKSFAVFTIFVCL